LPFLGEEKKKRCPEGCMPEKEKKILASTKGKKNVLDTRRKSAFTAVQKGKGANEYPRRFSSKLGKVSAPRNLSRGGKRPDVYLEEKSATTSCTWLRGDTLKR